MIAGGAVVAVGIAAITLAAVFWTFYQLAETHRAKAESLVRFMVFELGEKLQSSSGPEDVLDMVGNKALEFLDESAGGGETPERAAMRGVTIRVTGDIQYARGERALALKSYKQALQLFESIVASDRKNTEWQKYLASAHLFIGRIQWDDGDGRQALKSFEDALAIFKGLVRQEPANSEWQAALWGINLAIAGVQLAKDDRERALQTVQQALDDFKRLAAREPKKAFGKKRSEKSIWRSVMLASLTRSTNRRLRPTSMLSKSSNG